MSCCKSSTTTIVSVIIGGLLGAFASVPVQWYLGPKVASASTVPAPAPPAPEVDPETLRQLVREQIRTEFAEMATRRQAAAKRKSDLEAKATSLRSTVLTLRSMIEQYKVQHRRRAPTLPQLADDWSALTQRTDASGKPAGPGPNTYGPYMQAPPLNPLNGKYKVTARNAAVPADSGFVYEESTHKLWPVVPQNLEESVKGVLGGDYVVGPAVPVKK
jgi:hypothetical protein